MRIAKEYARVRVPAVAAHTGAGYGSMALAVGIWDEISVTLTTGEPKAVVLGEGSRDIPKDGRNPVIAALRKMLEELGLPQTGMELVCRNSIPRGCGLGESAVARAAAGMLIKALADKPDLLDFSRLLALCAPDAHSAVGVSAALAGGVTLTLEEDGGFRALCFDPHPQLKISVILPSADPLSGVSNVVLPQQVSRPDAEFNSSRAALLLHALTSAPQLLRSAAQARLAYHYRHDLMPDSVHLLERLRAAGWPALFAGSGPAILVFSPIPQSLADSLRGNGFRVLTADPVPRRAQ